MAETALWGRVRRWLRSGAEDRFGDRSGAGRGDGDDALRSDDVVASLPRLSRGRRNEVAIQQLQSGYERVVDLVDSIQQHQHEQDSRAREISASLAHVAQTLQVIQSVDGEQAATLSRIAEELRTANERATEWGRAVTELPRIAESQRETLASVAKQMEATAERDGRLNDSLASFREAVTSLGDATTASSVAIKSLQMSSLEGSERIADLMRQQNHRFTMLFVLTIVLVIVALTFVAVAWLR